LLKNSTEQCCPFALASSPTLPNETALLRAPSGAGFGAGFGAAVGAAPCSMQSLALCAWGQD